MKILGLKIEGLRKISMAELDFSKGHVTQIRGRNEAGKSTVVLACEILFSGAGSIPKDVIQHGKDKAQIVGTIGDYTVKRVITEKGTTLRVEKEGMVAGSPQALMDEISGQFLDPQWFSKLSGQEMKQKVMNYLGIDFALIDSEISDLEDKRRLTGRDMKTIGKPVEVEKVEEQSREELLSERKKIEEFNLKQDELQKPIAQAEKGLIDLAERKEKLQKEIEELQAEISVIETREQKGKEYIESLEKPEAKKSTDDIDSKLSAIEEINKKAITYQQYVAQKEKYEKKSVEYSKLSDKIKTKREEKDSILLNAEMPMPGLKITEDGLELNGISNENWSDSESLKIAMHIAAAFSKELKTMFIKRGESLDSSSLKEIEKFAEENDFQIIMEIVDDRYDINEDNVIYLEEGNIIDVSEKE